MSASTPALLTELHYADYIIKAMLNAMTVQQKAKVHEQLDKDGVSGEGMTRHHERAAVIAAAEAIGADPTSASNQSTSQQLRNVEARAVDVVMQAEHAAILLQAVFDKLDEIDHDAPAAAAINCFTTCIARDVELMRKAADNIVGLVMDGVAA